MKNTRPNHSHCVGALRQVRALAILKRKLTAGLSNQVIGKEFNLSAETISNEIKLALRTGIMEKFEDELLNGLVPDAIKAIKHALGENNPQVALEILKGTGILKKQSEPIQAVKDSNSDDLEVYIRTRPASRLPANGAPPLPSGGPKLLEPAPSPEKDTPALLKVDGLDRLPTIPIPFLDATMVEDEGSEN